MMKKPMATFFLLTGLLFQTLLPINLPVLLCVLTVIALNSSRSCALYAAVFAAMLHDVFSPAPIGISIPFFVLITQGICTIRNKVFSDQVITYVILGAGITILNPLYFSIAYFLFGIRPIVLSEIWVRLLIGLLVGIFLTPTIFFLFSSIRYMRVPSTPSQERTI